MTAHAQLRLARAGATDRRLPWERPLPPDRATPNRVRRDFPQILAAVGTTAGAPKPRGHPPGLPMGTRSGRAARYPAQKKEA